MVLHAVRPGSDTVARQSSCIPRTLPIPAIQLFGDTMKPTLKLIPGLLGSAVITATSGIAAADTRPAGNGTTLETVVVRAAREPITAGLSGNSVTVLDGNMLAKRQTAALSEILRTVPGVAVSRSGVFGAQTQVRMRGAEANHTLVFIDGVRANDPAQNGEFNFAHLLNADIETVEVIRGPQSALWGSDALAGVIDVRTRRGGDGLAGGVYAEGGENSWQNFGANARYGSDSFRTAVSITSLETDGDNISRQGGEDDGYDNTTVNGNLDWQLTDNLAIAGNLRYVDASNDFDNVDFSTGLPADSNSKTDVEQLYGRLAFTLDTLDGRWRHQASVSLTDTDNDNRSENAFAPSGFDQTSSDAEVLVYTFQTSFDIADGHTLTGAFERWEEDFEQRGAASPFGDPNRDEDIDTNSFVGEYRGQLTPDLTVLASVRNDDNSDFDDKTTGRVSAAWQLAGGATTLRGAYGTGIKNPTFTERFGFFTNFVGNPDLKPEESKGWEIGVDQRLLGDRMQLSATWFDEELEDEINGFFFDPGIGDFTAVNEDGKSEREGLELSGRWLIGSGLSLYAAYTWLDASEDDGSDEIRRAEHIASANINWDFLGGRGNLNLQVDYNGEQDDFFFPPVPPFQERVELDSFTLVTIAGSYRVLDNLELYARVENATDEDYEEIYGFVAPGRTAIAGVRYNFGR